MIRRVRNALRRFAAGVAIAALFACVAPQAFAQTPAARGHYQNFRTAIYIVVGSTRRLADRAVFDREFGRAMSQVPFDKVYLEVYRDRNFATDQEIEAVKGYFTERGVQVAGGVTPAAGGQAGQFGTFDYELPSDVAECRRAVELAARHFDEVILDDFFFYTSKSDADIAARGRRSWTEYRLDAMRRASNDCVLMPARTVNPDVRVTIKYPNWYEHFQGLGYDLEHQPHMFDAIYTGTETRDPYITDQLLQQYESYLIYRYFSNIRPDGGNLGGWVDTFSVRYVDRYAEQLWLTLFAKAPEITLFNWVPMSEARAVEPGARPWSRRRTSFNWRDMTARHARSGDASPPGWGSAAGYALEQADRVLGALGKPIGVASYRPHHAVGEDFLHNYLGNIGVPIDLFPAFPTQADTVLLTEAAAHDREIVMRIDEHLRAGKNVVVTSGLLCALERRGLDRIVELDCTGRRAAISTFINGFGAGSGRSLNDSARPNSPVLFPEIRFHTNDSWPIIRGVAGARGFPIVLMNRYSRGVLYVLNIPDNVSDLYALPRPLISQIKTYLFGDFPVRIDADPLVSLFAYDNDTFVVHSFRNASTNVVVSVAGQAARLRNVASNEAVAAREAPSPQPNARGPADAPRAEFAIMIEPHSFQAFRIER